MPYNRRGFRAPVRHNKEIFDAVFLGVAGGTTTAISFAAAVNTYAGGIGTCPISAKIKAVFIDISYTSGTIVPARMDWFVQKVPFGIPGLVPGATGGATARKFVILERKGLNNTNDGGSGNNPRAAAGWLMIPKRFQNMAEGDVWQIRAAGSTLYDLCVKVIYKWVA